MKKLLLLPLLALLLIGGLYIKKRFYDPKLLLHDVQLQVDELKKDSTLKDGDIIFQTSLSKQSRAIQLATHSKYSHCGLIYKIDSNYYVYEAVQPVKLTPLANWIAKGAGAHFVVKRLKNAKEVLTPNTLEKMKQVGNVFKGKNYDIYFDWSDDKIYCSELIWKTYQRATGLEIGRLGKLRDFDLSDDIVKQIMKKRYGHNIPYDETVISPASIFDSDLLTTIISR